MHRRVSSTAARALLALAVFVAAHADEVAAQMFSYSPDRPTAVQTASAAYTLVDFSFDGEGDIVSSFEFEGPLYGIAYSRPNFHATIGYGSDERPLDSPACSTVDCEGQLIDMRMLDASLTTWGEVRIAGAPGRGHLFIPIALHSSYRRVAPEGQEDSLVDAFNITVIGLGTGLGGSLSLGESVYLEGRAMPVIGLALRAFGDSAGNSRLIDTHVQLHVPVLAGRFGLSAGYGYRGQLWDVSASSLFPESQDDLFDYRGSSHSVTVGVNW